MSEPGPNTRKFTNLKKALDHGPTRLVFLGGIALAFIVVVLAFSTLGSSKPDEEGSAQLESVPVPVTSSARALDHPVNTQAYDELTQESNAQAAEQAKESGGTAMPVPRVGMAQPEAPASSVLPADVDTSDTTAAASTTATTDPQADAQAAQAARQQYERALAERYEPMTQQYDLLVKRWPGSGREAMTVRAAETPREQAQPAASVPATVVGTGGNAEFAPVPDIRANEAFLAVASSEANTDDMLPVVRAKVLNGPAKGAMLMGSIETSDNAPGGLVRFNLLTPADGGPSMAIDAVAIDPLTSRSSVASDVNRHTASRLAALFFSSILSGVSEGLLKGGQQERVIASGQNVVVQRDAYTDRDLAMIGLGKVGTNAAQMMQGAINRRPTVKLNLHTEIGVLFLKDLDLEHGTTPKGMP